MAMKGGTPSEQIKVFVRMRKLLKRELGSSTHWKCDEKGDFRNEIWSQDGSKRYTYDRVFSPEEDNATVYNEIGHEIIESALNGFNTTIFAYGQTGSGKTHTMLGSLDDPGFIQRAVSQIFDSIPTFLEKDFLLRVSYMEIYNENVTDLLSQEQKNLQVKDDPQGNVYVEDLQEIVIMESQQLFELMEEGEKNRHFGQTNMNERSSRSHTIFRIIIESAVLNEQDGHGIMVSHLNLVDLAGSERSSQTGAVGERFREGVNINKSLMTLGQVISKLSEGCTDHIPFRDSKLTRILKNSLGGNAKTSIISTITPCEFNQTKSTLDFASRAKKITQHAKVNEILDDRARMKRMHENIEVLTAEKQVLMEQLAQQAERDNDRVKELQEKLEEKERLLLEQRNQFCSSYFSELKLVKRPKMISRRQTWCPQMTRPRSSYARPISIPEESSFDHNTGLRESKGSDIATSFSTTTSEDANHYSKMVENSSFVTTKRQRKTVHFQPSIAEEVFLPTEEIKTSNESFSGTPKSVLRKRYKELSDEFEELREFTRLEADLKVQSCIPFEFEELTEKTTEIERLTKELSAFKLKHESIQDELRLKNARELELQSNVKHFQAEVDKLWQEKHDLQNRCIRTEELLTVSQLECQEVRSDLEMLKKTLAITNRGDNKKLQEDLERSLSKTCTSLDHTEQDHSESIVKELSTLLEEAKSLNKVLLLENQEKGNAIRELQEKLVTDFDTKKASLNIQHKDGPNATFETLEADFEFMSNKLQEQAPEIEKMKKAVETSDDLNVLIKENKISEGLDVQSNKVERLANENENLKVKLQVQASEIEGLNQQLLEMAARSEETTTELRRFKEECQKSEALPEQDGLEELKEENENLKMKLQERSFKIEQLNQQLEVLSTKSEETASIKKDNSLECLDTQDEIKKLIAKNENLKLKLKAQTDEREGLNQQVFNLSIKVQESADELKASIERSEIFESKIKELQADHSTNIESLNYQIRSLKSQLEAEEREKEAGFKMGDLNNRASEDLIEKLKCQLNEAHTAFTEQSENEGLKKENNDLKLKLQAQSSEIEGLNQQVLDLMSRSIEASDEQKEFFATKENSSYLSIKDNVEELKDENENLKLKLRTRSSEIDELNQQIRDLSIKSQETLDELIASKERNEISEFKITELLADHDKNLKTFDTEIQSLKSSLEVKETEKEAALKLLDLNSRASEETIQNLKSQLIKAENALTSQSIVEDLKEENNDLKLKLQAQSNEIDGLTRQVTVLSTKSKEKSAQLMSLKEQNEIFEFKINELLAEHEINVESLNRQIISLKGQLEAEETEKKTLELNSRASEETIEDLKYQLVKATSALTEQSEIEELKVEYESLKLKLQTKSSEIDELNHKMLASSTKTKEISDQLKASIGKSEIFESKVKELQADHCIKLQCLDEQIQSLKSQLEVEEKLKDEALNSLELNNRVVEETIEGLRSQLMDAKNALIGQTEVEDLKKENANLKLKLQALSSEMDGLNRQISDLLKKSKKTSDELKMLQEHNDKLDTQNRFEELMEENASIKWKLVELEKKTVTINKLRSFIEKLVSEKGNFFSFLEAPSPMSNNLDESEMNDPLVTKLQNYLTALKANIRELENSQAAASIRQLQVRATNDRVELADLRVKLRRKEEELKDVEASLNSQLESERDSIHRLKEELRRHRSAVDKSFVAPASKGHQPEERKPLSEVLVASNCPNDQDPVKKKESFQELMAKYENGSWNGGSGTVKEFQLDLLKQKVKKLEKERDKLKSRATEAEEFQRRKTTIWKTSFHKLKVQAEKCDNCKPTVTYISENLEN